MGTLTPAQNYDHVLNVVSGSDGMHDLQYKAAPASGQTFERGALVSLDASGNLIAGCGAHSMPMWAVNAVNDLDANSDVGNTSGGTINCFVGTGGYEIFTTEYLTDGSYAPNDVLTAGTSGDAGKVKEAASNYNDAVIVGIVSRGVQTSIYSQSVLYFWPVFIPKIEITIT